MHHEEFTDLCLTCICLCRSLSDSLFIFTFRRFTTITVVANVTASQRQKKQKGKKWKGCHSTSPKIDTCRRMILKSSQKDAKCVKGLQRACRGQKDGKWVSRGGELTALQVAGDRSRDAHLGAWDGLGHIGGLSQAAHESC